MHTFRACAAASLLAAALLLASCGVKGDPVHPHDVWGTSPAAAPPAPAAGQSTGGSPVQPAPR